ncbi:hypothetical protein MUG84_15895 [Paenibacillus sp. KQZ6P-2]|uniref:Uncharacterized protein n=1 Tax=Paenibacillus mangrovi TaxID=2931978 RepID=A0A9X2B3R0_9BACL|nr:hypothetical protein [Paenibacillus mangrovi]MCJ8013215.1 hypothetical protein [Paenibacillus mangrovi]
MNTRTLGEINRKEYRMKNNKWLYVLGLLILVLSLFGCMSQNSNSYLPNKVTPINVREEFYIKSVEVLNFYIKKVETESMYTEADNEYLLGYYRSMPSQSDEEINIKTSLTYLDLAYKGFDENLKAKKEEDIQQSINEFNKYKEEVSKQLELISKLGLWGNIQRSH